MDYAHTLWKHRHTRVAFVFIFALEIYQAYAFIRLLDGNLIYVFLEMMKNN